jgi:hypothetical protein
MRKKTVELGMPQMTIWRLRIARRIPNASYNDTLRICDTYCFCSVTMVARTGHDVMLYVHYNWDGMCSLRGTNLVFNCNWSYFSSSGGLKVCAWRNDIKLFTADHLSWRPVCYAGFARDLSITKRDTSRRVLLCFKSRGRGDTAALWLASFSCNTGKCKCVHV